nr:MAG TPA: hypothetical protein [Caudoviricetes sp.]
MLQGYHADSFGFIYTIPIGGIRQFRASWGFRIGPLLVGPCYSPWMHDKATAVIEHVYASAVIRVTFGFGLHETDWRTFAISNSTGTKEIGGVYASRYWASIIYNDTATLVCIKFHIGRISFGSNEVLFLQVCFGSRMHHHSGKLILCIAHELEGIDDCRGRNVGSFPFQCRNIQNMVFHGSRSEYASKDIDEFLLVLSSPIACYQVANSGHRVLTSQCGRQIGSTPFLSTHDGSGYIFLGCNFLCFDGLPFYDVVSVSLQIFEEWHVVSTCCFARQGIECRASSNNTGIEKCRFLHGFLHYVWIKQFRDDDIGNSSSCHLYCLLLD